MRPSRPSKFGDLSGTPWHFGALGERSQARSSESADQISRWHAFFLETALGRVRSLSE
jgi:hypothetical protein